MVQGGARFRKHPQYQNDLRMVFFSTSMLVYWRVMELEWVLYDMYESSPEFLEYVPNIDSTGWIRLWNDTLIQSNCCFFCATVALDDIPDYHTGCHLWSSSRLFPQQALSSSKSRRAGWAAVALAPWRKQGTRSQKGRLCKCGSETWSFFSSGTGHIWAIFFPKNPWVCLGSVLSFSTSITTWPSTCPLCISRQKEWTIDQLQ